MLREMSEAVAGFWDVMDYVYTESLNKKQRASSDDCLDCEHSLRGRSGKTWGFWAFETRAA